MKEDCEKKVPEFDKSQALRKLLILIDWFAPGYKAGGPIQSCVNLCAAINSYYNIFVLTTDTDHSEEEPYPGISTNQWMYDSSKNIHICYLQKKRLSTKEIKAQVDFINADIVYLNHLFSPLFVVYPLWMVYRRRLKATVIVSPRGALFESALSTKRYKKIPLLIVYKCLGIHKMVKFHATNEREKKAIQKHFPGSTIEIADNLPNLQQTSYETLSKNKGIVNCVFIARIVPIKNLLYLLNLLRNISEGKLHLTIIGPVEDKSYWGGCEASIACLPENISVAYIGAKKHEELSNIIKEHHFFLLPTTGENFGHSIFESFLAGRPVIISDQTPWLNLKKEFAGWDIALDDPATFEMKIKEAIDMAQEEYDLYTRGAWNFAHSFLNNIDHIHNYKVLFGNGA